MNGDDRTYYNRCLDSKVARFKLKKVLSASTVKYAAILLISVLSVARL